MADLRPLRGTGSPAPGAATPKGGVPRVESREPGDRASTGNGLLDHFLRGGLPRGAATLLLGPPYSGKELVAAGFAHASAVAGEPIAVVLTGMTPTRFRLMVHQVGSGFEEAEDENRVAYVDCYAGMLGEEATDPFAVAAPSPDEPESVLRAVAQARARLGDPARMGVVVLGLTDLVLRAGARRGPEGHAWLQRLLGQVRRWEATALLSAEGGVHGDAELSLFRHLCDATIEFMEADDARLFLRARGLGGAVTRDWVEYVLGDSGLDITGSFTEQKIR